jgi:hydrogenase 3 maturation protease
MIKKLEADLRDWMRKSSVKETDRRIAVLGVGSDLRADDAAGILIAQKLRDKCSANPGCFMASFLGYTAPENMTGEIIAFKPTHLIVIDAADFVAKPGFCKFLSIDEVGGVSFSTHQLPMKVITDYIVHSCSCDVAIIGIQPGSLEFDGQVTAGVLKSVEDVAGMLWAVTGNSYCG